MSNMGNKYKVGVLVILALVGLILSLLSLGVLKYFRKTYEFMTVVDCSVQGLEKGAKVKFKGVTIGQVSSIKITPEENLIYIFMQFDPQSIVKQISDDVELEKDGEHGEKMFKIFIKDAVKKGLRCQLQMAGITGTLFVDISYFDAKQYPVKDYRLPNEHIPYLPSVETVSIVTILEKIQKSVIEIGEINFKKLFTRLDDFLKTANSVIDNGDVTDTLQEIRRIGGNLREVSESLKNTFTRERMMKIDGDLQKAFDNIQATLTEIKRFSQEADQQLKQSKIPETSRKAREFLDEGTKAASVLGDVKKDFRPTLRRLNDTLIALRELINYLEKNPSSIVRGKAEKRVVEP